MGGVVFKVTPPMWWVLDHFVSNTRLFRGARSTLDPTPLKKFVENADSHFSTPFLFLN